MVYLGTGKTLMARQIGKMLNTREPKIISGPGKIYFAMFDIYAVFLTCWRSTSQSLTSLIDEQILWQIQ